jgi:hypothetical protein
LCQRPPPPRTPFTKPYSDGTLLNFSEEDPAIPGQRPRHDEVDFGMRWAATKHGEASLQMFLLRRGLPVPLSDHILKNSSKQIELLSKN